LPNLPDVEAFWYGCQYLLACASSDSPLVAAPGLYGPWVTADGPRWHGDYTLDFNYQAQYYGVFGSNHATSAESYFTPILDWMPRAGPKAQYQAWLANVSCPTEALYFACHLAPWGQGTPDLMKYYMAWTGHFASLAFINHWEYTRNASFALSATLPLLDGLNKWYACYMSKHVDPHNSSNYWYMDDNPFNPDMESEEQPVVNPQIALSMLQRTLWAQEDICSWLNVSFPPELKDLKDHMPPYNTANTTLNVSGTLHNVTVFTNWYNSTVAGQGDNAEFANYMLFPVEAEDFGSPAASPEMQAIAQASVAQWYGFPNNPGRTDDTFPGAIRTRNSLGLFGNTPEVILDSFRNSLITPLMLNSFIAPCEENMGMSRPINEMLLQSWRLPTGSHPGMGPFLLEVFPFWPVEQPASFTTLLAKGGFEVSAAYSEVTKTVSGVFVNAKHTVLDASTSRVSLVNPWGNGTSTVVTCGSSFPALSVSPEGWLSWDAPRGVSCSVAPSK